MKSFGLSDIGPCRTKNEDVWIALPDIGFFALADGMGGHKAGEVAASETIENITHSIRKIKTQDPLELIIELRHAIEKANQWVYRLSQKEKSLTGMGTTLCCLLWNETFVIYAHVGDSRIYRLREERLELLTQDHSLFAKWEKTGKTSQTPFPYKNVITRAIGTSQKANPEIAISTYMDYDRFFLCSDGLSDVLTLKEIEKILNQSESLESGSKELISAAKNKGSSDNITILMMEMDHSNEKNLPGQQRNNSDRQSSSGENATRSRAPSQPL